MKLKASLLICIFLTSFLAVFSGFDPSVQAAQYWSDGFESGNHNAWTSETGVVIVSTDLPYTGLYGASVNTESGNMPAYLSKTHSYTELYFCCRYYFDVLDLPSETWPSLSRFRIMSIEVDGVNGISLLVGRGSPTNYWKVQYGDYEFSDYIGTLPPAAGNWYGIELHWNNTGGTQKTWEVWINGTNIFSLTGTDTYSSITTNVQLGAWDYDGVNTPWIISDFDDAVTGNAYLGCPPVGGPTPDTDPPTYETDFDYSTNIVGESCNFSVTINDNVNVSGYLLSVMNNTSNIWYNTTWTDCADASLVWASALFTLPAEDTLIVKYKFFANDTTNNWSGSTMQETLPIRTTYGSLPDSSAMPANNPPGTRRVVSVTSGSTTAVLTFDSGLNGFFSYIPLTQMTYTGVWDGFLPSNEGTLHAKGSSVYVACWHGYNNFTHPYQNFAEIMRYTFVPPFTLSYRGSFNIISNDTRFVLYETKTIVYNSYWLSEFPGAPIIYGYYSFAFATAINGHTTVAVKCNGDFSYELTRVLLYDLSDDSYIMTQLGASSVIGATPIALAADPYYIDGYVFCFSYRATQLVKYRRWTGTDWHEFIPSIEEKNMGTTNDHAWSITYSASANRTYFAGSSVGIYHLANGDNYFSSDSVAVYGTAVCIGATRSQVIVLQTEDIVTTSCVVQTAWPSLSSWNYVDLFHVNNTAGVMCPAISTGTAKLPFALIRATNSYNITLAEFGSDYLSPYMSAIDGENIDGNGLWVFTDWKYYTFRINVPNQDEEIFSNLTDVGIRFNVSTSQEEIMCDFYANNTERNGTWSTYGDDEWIWSFNSSLSSELATRFGQPVKLQEGTVSYDSTYNETDITFQIWFDKQCLDIYNPLNPVAIYALCNWASYSLSWFDSDQTFLVYSKGGFSKDFNTTNYAYANALAGEEWCSLYAYNGTTVSNTIWFRDLQHIKLLPQVDFLAGRSVFYITTYIEYSTGQGEWLPGWKNIIAVSYVSYTAIFASNVWINMTSAWFQGSGTPGSYDWVKTDNIYMFYHGSVGTAGNPGRWSFWIDMWFNNINASSTGGGRVNAFEFPMNDNADLWMRWLANNWGVKDNVDWTSNYMGDLKDTDGNIMNCQKIKMVRVKMELEVTQAEAIQLAIIHNFPVLDYTHSPELPLVGIQTPVFDETKMPNVGQTGLLGAVFSMFSGIGQWLSENVIFGGLNLWSNFVAFLDTIAAWLGAPKFFSNLFKWIADGFGYMVSSATFMFQLLSAFFTMLGSLLASFVSVLSEFVLSIIATLGYLVNFLGGVGTGAGDLWTQFNIWGWLQVALIFYPLYLILLWEERGLDPVIAQLTMIWGIAAWLFGFFIQIIQAMIGIMHTLIESIPVAE
ncbi:MAG: hypothetical protein MUP17_09505 [candidate division Zixibacteria bacterium]|nr:hypothetical protein [candidate division Zixibacteria bacterium]